MIDIHELCFAYDSMEVLHNIELSIADGCFAIMVGPNGGGKTTLLRLILGLLQPAYGTVTVAGMTPVKARRLMSYVPQSLIFDTRFPASVLDVVLMGRVDRHLFGPYSRHDRDVAEHALNEVSLNGYDKRPFSALSGGERQRVLVAQALVAEPSLMLLDEPGANLDPDNRLMLYELLHRLNKHITILLVSHNLNVIASFATHVICVNRTAVMHPIEDVRTQELEDGTWTHLMHAKCPVGDESDAAMHTPHAGRPHDAH